MSGGLEVGPEVEGKPGKGKKEEAAVDGTKAWNARRVDGSTGRLLVDEKSLYSKGKETCKQNQTIKYT